MVCLFVLTNQWCVKVAAQIVRRIKGRRNANSSLVVKMKVISLFRNYLNLLFIIGQSPKVSDVRRNSYTKLRTCMGCIPAVVVFFVHAHVRILQSTDAHL